MNPETLGQPSSYKSTMSANELLEIDTDKKLLDKAGFSQTEKGVLENYYDMQDNLKKLQKEYDIAYKPIEIEDDNGITHTWIQVTLNKNLRRSAFGLGLVPTAISADRGGHRQN